MSITYATVALRPAERKGRKARVIWVTGTQDGWSHAGAAADVFEVGGLLVVHNMAGAPIAVLRDDKELSDYCATRFGVRP